MSIRIALIRSARWLCFGLILLAVQPSGANPIEFSIDQSSVLTATGQTVKFTGTITNRSGVTLTSTDLFFDFANYDFNSIEPVQLLGLVPFSLPDSRFRSGIDLFEINVLATASFGILLMDVTLQDVNGNVSIPATTSLIIVSAVPEPAGAGLLAVGTVALLATRRRGRRPFGEAFRANWVNRRCRH